MKKMTTYHARLALLALSASALAGQTCPSVGAARIGGWESIQSAPRDGTVIEILQTGLPGPWYGLYKWTATGRKIMKPSGAADDGQWSRVDPGTNYTAIPPSVICLAWRPYRDNGKPYVDPTQGEQNTISYWCGWMGQRYDPRKRTCR